MSQMEPRILLRGDGISGDPLGAVTDRHSEAKAKETEQPVRQEQVLIDDGIPDAALEVDASVEDGIRQSGDTVLFPGRFRPNKTAFGFRNRREEQAFVSTVLALSREKRVRLRVQYDDPRPNAAKRRMGTARTKAVLRYLKEQGVKKNAMVIGKPVDAASGQQPHPGFVDLIIDQ